MVIFMSTTFGFIICAALLAVVNAAIMVVVEIHKKERTTMYQCQDEFIKGRTLFDVIR